MSKSPDSSNQPPSIVFFGAGPVASESLRQLLPLFKVEAVITKPQTKNNTAPVLDLANQHNLPIFTPSNRLELSEIFQANSFSSQAGVVIDFGIIIASDVFDSFEYGIVNSHFSLLPEWRGADPITFSILSGQKTTGVSLMRIVEALDEGPIIAQQEIKIPAKYDVNQLTSDLIRLSTDLLEKHLPAYINGSLSTTPQEDIAKENKRPVSYSKKINKSDGLIDWSKPATVIEREIRAYAGWPQSRSSIAGLDIIITRADVSDKDLQPGQPVVEGKTLSIGCGDGSIEIKRLKPAGKKEMDVAGFLAGYGTKLK